MDRDAQPAPANAAASPIAARPRQVPLDPPMLPFAIGGTVLWAVAALTLLPMRGWLADNGHGSWFGVCVAGTLLGIPGIITMVRHDAGRRRRRQAQPTGDSTTDSTAVSTAES